MNYILLQNQYLNDVQMLNLQMKDLENKKRMLRNSNINLTQRAGKYYKKQYLHVIVKNHIMFSY